MKTLEAGINMLVDAGFGDEIREVKDRLWGKDAQSQRDQAFNRAFESALKSLPDHALLDNRIFQEEVVSALLDPMNGFNPQAAAKLFLQKHPHHTLALKRFFSALENQLLIDEYWGELLTRYQTVRFQENVQQTLEKRGLPTNDRLLIQHVIATGGSGVAIGTGAKAVGRGGVLIEGSV